MADSSARFSIQVGEVKGVCPAGEAWARKNMESKKIPVFSCDGPCIRGEIARLAANHVAQEVPSYARACQEVWCVPHSSMTRWAKEADRSIVIDGCFLQCHGRIVDQLLGRERVIHLDALPLHRKYGSTYLMDDVSEDERKIVARSVADQILTLLRERGEPVGTVVERSTTSK